MTDKQINQAIAEACGIVGKDQYGPLYQTEDGWVVDCPDYCNDLNAMHEAEKVLAPKDEGRYFLTLKQMVGDLIWYRDTCRNYRATARQRAEAFLRALGKWEPTTEESSAVQKEVQG